jgi:hypothetical protein
MRRVLTTKAASLTLLSLFLLLAAVCPAICLAQVAGSPSHACCPVTPGHPGDSGGKQVPAPCRHMTAGTAETILYLPSGVVAAPLPAASLAATILLPVAVMLPPAPRPVHPRPQRLLTVLRI